MKLNKNSILVERINLLDMVYLMNFAGMQPSSELHLFTNMRYYFFQLRLCHEQPDATEALFSILKKMIQHSLPFQAACDCGICTDCFEDAYDSACKKQHSCLGSAKDNLSEFQPNEDVKSLWCSICYHIQNYITRRLIGDNEVLSPKRGLVDDTNWESYFEMLSLLFVSGQVQRIHHWVRSEQLQHASCPCKPTVSTCCVTCLIQWCVQSLAKDVAMRPSLGMTWHDLSDSYISSVRANVVLCLQQLRSHWQRRNEIEHVSPFLLPCLLNPNSCWAHRDTKCSQDDVCCADVWLQQSDSCHDRTDQWVLVALINLITELHWFEQQLSGISCRTWGESLNYEHIYLDANSLNGSVTLVVADFNLPMCLQIGMV